MDFLYLLIAVFFIAKFFIQNSVTTKNDSYLHESRNSKTTIVNQEIHNHLHISDKQLKELTDRNK